MRIQKICNTAPLLPPPPQVFCVRRGTDAIRRRNVDKGGTWPMVEGAVSLHYFRDDTFGHFHNKTLRNTTHNVTPMHKCIEHVNSAYLKFLRLWVILILSFLFIYFYWFHRESRREGGREKETLICCSTYLCVYWLISFLCPDQRSNLQTWHMWTALTTWPGQFFPFWTSVFPNLPTMGCTPFIMKI